MAVRCDFGCDGSWTQQGSSQKITLKRLVTVQFKAHSWKITCWLFFTSFSPSAFLLIDFHIHHFYTYDCFLIGDRTTNGANRELLSWLLSNAPNACILLIFGFKRRLQLTNNYWGLRLRHCITALGYNGRTCKVRQVVLGWSFSHLNIYPRFINSKLQ